MPAFLRVTVTLPENLVHDLDRQERNRSKFVAQAIRNELERRRLEDLTLSLENPHPETLDLASHSLADWSLTLPDEDAVALLDPSAGRPVSWTPGAGWKDPQD